uniref:RE33542p n=1 Tax=Drosophila melanogaster TaxID=7227 RepID=Q8MZ01_DROME|nr:RE33542p [Drosophila melanogaster]
MDLPIGKLNGLLKMQIFLLQLLLFVSPALLQQPHVFYHPRQLYYDSPRLRRFEYGAAATPIVGGYSPAPPPAIHFQQQTPHFQLINYRPSYQPLGLDYQQQSCPLLPHPLRPCIRSRVSSTSSGPSLHTPIWPNIDMKIAGAAAAATLTECPNGKTQEVRQGSGHGCGRNQKSS